MLALAVTSPHRGLEGEGRRDARTRGGFATSDSSILNSRDRLNPLWYVRGKKGGGFDTSKPFSYFLTNS